MPAVSSSRSVPRAFAKALSVVAMLALGACAKEKGRVPFAGEGSSSADISLASGEVDFWVDISIKYVGTPHLDYEIELLQGGSVVAKTTCNPLGPMSVKLGWLESDIGDTHSRSGSGKMACSANLPQGGTTTVKARLARARWGASVSLEKADLVVKQ